MQEKLMILKMLENGQITAAEAENLLKSVGAGGGTPPSASTYSPAPPPIPHSTTHTHSSYSPPLPPPPPAPKSAYSGYNSNTRPSGTTPPPSSRPSGTSPDYVARSISTVEDLSRKFESFAKDLAPKVQKFTEVVADKIAGAADMVSGAFVSEEPPSAHSKSTTHQPHKHEPSKSAPLSGMKEANIEMLVESGGFCEFSISGLNGDVRIKGYNGDKITARISYRMKRHSAPIELMKLGGKYFLKYDADDFHAVSIDAYVPERAFGVIKIDGTNCQMDCSSLAANEMLIINSNGSTRLSGIACNNIQAESSNGLFNVSNITAENATIENMNGTLEASELDVANLKLNNYNGPLSFIMSKFDHHSDYVWSVETANAKLNMNLPTLPNLGYHIKAHATMGEIRLGLTGLQFLINDPSLVEARGVYFDSCARKVKMAIETSNAPLIIN